MLDPPAWTVLPYFSARSSSRWSLNFKKPKYIFASVLCSIAGCKSLLKARGASSGKKERCCLRVLFLPDLGIESKRQHLTNLA